MNYYDEKLLQIKKLMKKDKSKALSIINKELDMPYIPEKYEASFISLADELKFELNKDSNEQQLPKEKIINYLFSDDKFKIAAAIDSLRNINVRTILKDIEKWLFLNSADPVGQAIIYEILVEQEIDKLISFGNIQINPFKNGEIMKQKEIEKSFKKILNSNETPQIQESSIEELKFYILKTFPNFPESGNLLASELMTVVKSLLENKNDFSGFQLDIYNIIKQK